MSPSPAKQHDTALRIFGKSGLVPMPDLHDADIEPETVARLVRDGTVVRIARRLYELSDTVPEARRSLAEASALVPKSVICLASALQFHEMTMQEALGCVDGNRPNRMEAQG